MHVTPAKQKMRNLSPLVKSQTLLNNHYYYVLHHGMYIWPGSKHTVEFARRVNARLENHTFYVACQQQQPAKPIYQPKVGRL